MEVNVESSEGQTMPDAANEIFVSYSHKDSKWLKALKTHLGPLARGGQLTLWDDTMIAAGDQWRQEIQSALERAAAAVLLVSPDFLNSWFIVEHELPRLLATAKSGKLRVFWIPVRDSVYVETEIVNYQAAHNPDIPLATLTPAKRDAAFKTIVLNIKKALTVLPESWQRSTAVPSPTPSRLKGDRLLAELGQMGGSVITTSLLAGEWTLSDLDDALQDDGRGAVKLIDAIATRHGDTWPPLVGAYAAQKGRITGEQIIELGFRSSLPWGSRHSVLSYLRFVPESRRRALADQLMEMFGNSESDWDTKRLAIYALGFINEEGSIRYLLHQESAYSEKYPNEKLGPYGVMAFLHCYLFTMNDYIAGGLLADFVDITQTTSKLGNLRLHFLDYVKKLQIMPPGKGVGLFRVLRDHHLVTPLSAVLAAFTRRPNPLLLDELIELGKSDDPVALDALHAAAYIGTLTAAQRLRGLVSGGYPKARAAYILASGLAGWKDVADDITAAASDVNLPRDAEWTNDVLHVALWAVGELSRHDRAMAVRILESGTCDPQDGYTRGLCWLGLAKSSQQIPRERYFEAFETATDFFEKTLVSVAAALSGWPDLLAPAIKGTIDNHSPIYNLQAHFMRDLRAALLKTGGRGGADLLTLLDLGDFA
jgi:hypothetical protein